MQSKINKELQNYFKEEDYELLHWGYFKPDPEYRDLEHGCCICCSGVLPEETPFYIESLVKNDSNKYLIKKICLIYYESTDESYFTVSHNTYKDGNHPYQHYKKYMKGNSKNEYYLFLKNNKLLGNK